MAVQSIFSLPANGGAGPSPATTPTTPQAPSVAGRVRSIFQTPSLVAHNQTVAVGKQLEQKNLSDQLPKISTPLNDPNYVASISSVPELQNALKTGTIDHNTFLTRFAQIAKAPTKATTANKVGDVLGGLKIGATQTGEGITQGLARTTELLPSIEPNTVPAAPASKAGPTALSTKTLGPAPKVSTATPTPSIIRTPQSGILSKLIGKAPITSLEAQGEQTAASHPGGFQIPHTPIKLTSAETGLALTAIKGGVDVATALSGAKGLDTRIQDFKAGQTAAKQALTNVATKNAVDAISTAKTEAPGVPKPPAEPAPAPAEPTPAATKPPAAPVKTETAPAVSKSTLESKPAVETPAPKAKASVLPPRTEEGSVPHPAAIVSDAKTMIAEHNKPIDYSTDLEKAGNQHEGNRKNINQDTLAFMKNQSKGLTPKDLRAIQDYRDAKLTGQPTTELTPRQLEVNDNITELNKARFKAEDTQAELEGRKTPPTHPDPETYVHREAVGKNSEFDQLLAGSRKSITKSSGFGKRAGSDKARVFHALVDENGNRTVASIATGKDPITGKVIPGGKHVTVLDKANTVKRDLGPLRKPPVKKIDEFTDANVRAGLDKLAKNLGINVKRLTTRRGRFVGRSYVGKPKIELKAGAPERVMLHEIGHQLDEKFDLKKTFVNNKNFKTELRKLADLRFEGHEDTTSASFKQYARKGEEKIAVMFEAYLHNPSKFQEVAPKTFKAFEKFLNAHDETRPITQIKPSLVIQKNTVTSAEEQLPGHFIGNDGKTYKIADATISEIEKATGQKYVVHPVLDAAKSYADKQTTLANVRFIESLKSHPDFKEFSAGPDEVAPKGWEPVKGLMQFQGYKFHPDVASVMDRIANGGGDRATINADLGRFLQKTITYFPLKHVVNEGVTYGTARGLTSYINPLKYNRMRVAFKEAGVDVQTASRIMSKSFNDTTNMTPLWREVQARGFNLVSTDSEALGRFTKAQLKSLDKPEGQAMIADIAKRVGSKPADVYKQVQRVSVWQSQDRLNMALIREFMKPTLFNRHGASLKDVILARDAGKITPEMIDEAIRRTERSSLQYRIPTRVATKVLPGRVGRGISSFLSKPIVFFGRYRYDLFRILTNNVLDTVNLKTLVKDPKQNFQAADRLAAMAVMGAIIWPAVDGVIQKVSHVPNAYVKGPGTAELPEAVTQIIQGKKGLGTTVAGQVYLSSVVTNPLDLKNNRDSFTGKPIYNANGSLSDAFKSIANWEKNQLAPVQNVSNLNKATGQGGNKAVNLFLALSSVRFPKSSAQESKLLDLKDSSLVNFVQPEAKAAAAKGNINEAISKIQAYDDKVVAAAKTGLKAQGIPVPNDKTLINQLKASQFYYDPTLKTVQGWQTTANKPKAGTLQTIMSAKAAPKKGDPGYRAYTRQKAIQARNTKSDKAAHPQNYQPVIKP